MLLFPELVESVANPKDRRHAMTLDQRLQEVQERRLSALDRPPQTFLLLRRGEVGREEEDRQITVLVQRVGELVQLLADLVEHAMLLGDLEQRPRIDLGDLLHQRWSPPLRALKSSSRSASSTSCR